MQYAESNVRRLNGVQIGALVVAALGIVFSFIGALIDLDHFFRVYFVAFLFWVELSLGCLGALMLSNLISGRWLYAMQRLAAAGARTLPLMGILFVPLLFRLDQFFPWAAEGAVEEGTFIPEAFLNEGFFVVRVIVYFVIWIGLAYLLSAWSYESDKENSNAQGLWQRSQALSALGMILFFITVSLATVDWLMSLHAGWFSSIFGWITISRQGLAALGLMVLFLALLWRHRSFARLVTERVRMDIGTVLFTALMVWLYLNVIQFIVMWSGNLPKKVLWYDIRFDGGWGTLAWALVIFHAVAFVLLLVPGFKRIRLGLVAMAALLLFARLVELYWIVVPAFSEEIALQWWDIALPIAIGGLWIALFIWLLKRHQPLPLNHPELQETMASQEGERYEAA